ncbi:MAG: hypothetical protein AAEJ47_04340 [Planctomycetota bacterium]
MRNLCPELRLPTALLIAVSVTISVLLSTPLEGQNGTIEAQAPICGSNPTGSDLTVDTSDGTVWTIDSTSGKICVYNTTQSPPSMALANMIDHPVGPAVAPSFQPQCTGLAYCPTTDSFWILNSTSFELVQMDRLGAQIGVPLPFSINGSASGLTCDLDSGNLWLRDTVNQLAVEIDPNTGVVVSTLPIPGDVIRYGVGIAYRMVSGEGFLDFTYGDVFDATVSELLTLSISTGQLECTNVPLPVDANEPILGIARQDNSSYVYALTTENLLRIDGTQPSVTPPADLFCSTDGEGSSNLSWRNCGPGAGGFYNTIRITRNGAIVDTLPGSATSWVDSSTASGFEYQYQVQGVVGSNIASSSCSVINGPGGLVSYIPFQGNRPRDLAYDAEMDDLYVTESFSGEIQVLDSNLNLKRTIDTGLTNLRGIGYNSIMDLLLVSRVNSSLVTFVEPLTGVVLSSFPSNTPDVTAISYDSFEDDWLLFDTGANPVTILRMEALEGAEGNPLGSITPPQTSGLNLGGGIASLTDGTLMSGVDSSGDITSISQFTSFGFPLNFDMTLLEMGNSPTTLNNAVTGFEVVGSDLVVAGNITDTLFKFLIVSDGPDFLRGDSDGSGSLNLADAIFTASWLYADGTTPDCLDACDTNDDGRLDISDPIYTLLYLFAGSAAPPEPYPLTGPDPTFLDEIGC